MGSFQWQSTPMTTHKPGSVEDRIDTALTLLREFFKSRPQHLLLGTFREFDRDNSGVMSIQEFCRALYALNINLAQREMEEIFHVFDGSGDGKIDMSEFISAMVSESDAENHRFFQVGIGKQFLETTREPPSTEGVGPSIYSGYSRGWYAGGAELPSGGIAGYRASDFTYSQSSKVIGAGASVETDIDAAAANTAASFARVNGF